MGRKKLAIFIICFIGIVLFFIYFTRPISLANDIRKENTNEISMYVYFPSKMEQPEMITIKDKDNINSILSVLNDFQYHKKIKIKNLLPLRPINYPANTDPFIQIFIWYQNDDETIGQQVVVHENKSVEMARMNRILLEYKARTNGKDIFYEFKELAGELLKNNN